MGGHKTTVLHAILTEARYLCQSARSCQHLRSQGPRRAYHTHMVHGWRLRHLLSLTTHTTHTHPHTEVDQAQKGARWHVQWGAQERQAFTVVHQYQTPSHPVKDSRAASGLTACATPTELVMCTPSLSKQAQREAAHSCAWVTAVQVARALQYSAGRRTTPPDQRPCIAARCEGWL